MNATQWQKVEGLYYNALDVPEAERAAFLAQVCADDEALRREVESLLAARDEAGGFLSQPVVARSWLSGTSRAELNARLGSTIGQYQLLSVLGVGGMGEVFLAEDTRLHRQVALKLLPPQFSQQPGRVRRFEQEARVTTALNHPNIVTLYDTGEHDGSYFIVNEFVDGQTLRAYLNERGPLPIREAVDIAQQIATALAAAHAAGIVHRDIKPENVMLRRDGFVKVLDFGLAKLASPLPDLPSEQEDTHDEENPHAAIANPQSQTATGTLLGTLCYMSPEQARRETVDARTDVFSLGVVLYEMLVGEHPFARPIATQTLAAILEAEAPALSAFAPTGLQQLLKQALAKDRGQRLQTSAELAAGLRQLAEEKQANMHLKSAPWWRRWPVWLGLASLLGSVMALVYFTRQPQTNYESTILPALKTVPLGEWKRRSSEDSLDSARLSPDDQQFVFARFQDEQRDVFVESIADKGVDNGPTRNLTNDQWEDEQPIWSPDGKQVLYVSVRNNRRELWRVPAAGGATQFVLVWPEQLAQANAYLVSWANDWQHLYVLAACELYQLRLADGHLTPLLNLAQGGCALRYVELSADEQWLAYHSPVSGVQQIFVQRRAGGKPVQLTHDAQDNWFPVWHSDRQRLFHSCKRNDVWQICVSYLNGRPTDQITFSPENLTLHDAARAGQRLLYKTERNESDLFRYDLPAGAETRLSGGSKFECNPAGAPDGQSILYQQATGEADFLGSEIWEQPFAAYAMPQRLVRNGFAPQWAPAVHGQTPKFAFLRKAAKLYSLLIYQPEGKGAQPLVENDVTFSGYVSFPYRWGMSPLFAWSPDGSRLAYCVQKAGSTNLWTIASDGSNAQPVTNYEPNKTERLHSPSFAPDGRRLAYLKTTIVNGVPQWQVCLAESGQPQILYQATHRLYLLGWAAQGAELYLLAVETAQPQQIGEGRLYSLNISNQTLTTLARIPAVYHQSFRLAPTGTQLAFAAHRNGRDELWRFTLSDRKARRVATMQDPLVYLGEIAWAADASALYTSKQFKSTALGLIENYR